MVDPTTKNLLRAELRRNRAALAAELAANPRANQRLWLRQIAELEELLSERESKTEKKCPAS